MQAFPPSITARSALLSLTDFIMGINEKFGGESLMHALLHFFYLSNYKVIIEGIETLEHKKWLD